MGCTCIRQTDLPHTQRLFADLVYHPDRLRAFYSYPHFDMASCAAAAREVDFPAERRAALVEALAETNPGSRLLGELARPGAVAVVTGQQVGLFSGPAYTIYKALTAVRLARELSGAGIPAVPLFWLATEDHDFAEVNHAWLFNPEHQPTKLEMRRSASGQPVGEVRLSEPPLTELAQALAGFPFAAEVQEMIAASYAAGATMGSAFSALLRRLLGPHELLHVDPMAPRMRALAAPAIRAALAAAPELTAAVLARNRELIQAGYHAQVHVEESTSFVFLLENGRRTALRRHEREYVSNGRRFQTGELIERAERLSPNALLRPVVQDSMLPTVAYVGGPAELAYLAQAEVIYRAILGRMPVALHRTGFTLLDARSRKLLDRYGLALTDCFHGEEVLRERIATRLIPPALAGSLEETRARMAGGLDGLAASLAGFDASLAAALAKSRRKIEYQLIKTERKIARETLARDTRATRDAAYLDGLIYPHKHLQERLYSILPFVARHGLDLIGRLYDNVRLDCPDHQLIVL